MSSDKSGEDPKVILELLIQAKVLAFSFDIGGVKGQVKNALVRYYFFVRDMKEAGTSLILSFLEVWRGFEELFVKLNDTDSLEIMKKLQTNMLEFLPGIIEDKKIVNELFDIARFSALKDDVMGRAPSGIFPKTIVKAELLSSLNLLIGHYQRFLKNF